MKSKNKNSFLRSKSFKLTIIFKLDGYTAVHAENMDHSDVFRAIDDYIQDAYVLITSFRTAPKFENLSAEAVVSELAKSGVDASVIEDSEFVLVNPQNVEGFFRYSEYNPLLQMSFAMLKDSISAADLELYGVVPGVSIGTSNLGPIAYADSFGPEGMIYFRDEDHLRNFVNYAFRKALEGIQEPHEMDVDYIEALAIHHENHAATYKVLYNNGKPAIIRRDMGDLNAETFVFEGGKWTSLGIEKLSRISRFYIKFVNIAKTLITLPLVLVFTLVYGLFFVIVSIVKVLTGLFRRQK